MHHMQFSFVWCNLDTDGNYQHFLFFTQLFTWRFCPVVAHIHTSLSSLLCSSPVLDAVLIQCSVLLVINKGYVSTFCTMNIFICVSSYEQRFLFIRDQPIFTVKNPMVNISAWVHMLQLLNSSILHKSHFTQHKQWARFYSNETLLTKSGSGSHSASRLWLADPCSRICQC